jgi:LuxR family maltose regulon positive regulatory protein
VSRPRLLERVQAGLLGKLTLIAAPAGFGKTTVLSAWIALVAASDVRLEAQALQHARTDAHEPYLHAAGIAWLSLDTADNDPTRFWRYVIAAMVYPHRNEMGAWDVWSVQYLDDHTAWRG